MKETENSSRERVFSTFCCWGGCDFDCGRTKRDMRRQTTRWDHCRDHFLRLQWNKKFHVNMRRGGTGRSKIYSNGVVEEKWRILRILRRFVISSDDSSALACKLNRLVTLILRVCKHSRDIYLTRTLSSQICKSRGSQLAIQLSASRWDQRKGMLNKADNKSRQRFHITPRIWRENA